MTVKKIIPIILTASVVAMPLASCGHVHQETEQEKWCNDYCERCQSSFLNSITINPHKDWWKQPEEGGNLYISSEAEAVCLWAYGPAYSIWATSLHKFKGTSELDRGGRL